MSALSRVEAVSRILENLREILTRDPVLRETGLDADVDLLSVEEIDSLIALERGQAMCVHVERANATKFKVVVSRSATVFDFKRAVRRAVTLEQTKSTSKKPSISWKHVWRSNWLVFDGSRLKDDSAKLKDLGLVNGSRVAFSKKRKGD